MADDDDRTLVKEFSKKFTKSLLGGQGAVSLLGIVVSIADDNVIVRVVAAIALAMSIAGFFAVDRLSRVHSAKLARSRVRAALVLLVLTYAAGTGLVVWFGPVDVAPVIWGGIGLFGILATVELAVLVRTASLPDTQWADTPQLFVVALHWLLGAAVLGVAGGLVGLASAYFRDDLPFVGITILVEAAWIVGLGLTVLFARPAVIALASSSTGVVLLGFGLASLRGGDELFGAGIIGLGVAAIVLGVAIYLRRFLATAYLVATVASAFHAFASFRQAEVGLGIALCFLAAILGVLVYLAFAAPEVGGLSRYANDLRPWRVRRYFLWTIPFVAVLCAVSLWESRLLGGGADAGVLAVAGLSAGSAFAIIVLVTAGIRRWRSSHTSELAAQHPRF